MSNRNKSTFNAQRRGQFRLRTSRHLGISVPSRGINAKSIDPSKQSIAVAAPSRNKRRRYSSRNRWSEQERREIRYEARVPQSRSDPSDSLKTALESSSVSQKSVSGKTTQQEVHVNGSVTELPESAAAGPSSGSSIFLGNAAKRGRRRVRRAPKRKWKPYFKLTNEERRLLEIREEKRAERIRAQRFKSGLPVAPYNTTQFLFNDLQARGGGGSLADEQVMDVDRIVESIRHHHRSESNERDSVVASVDGSHAIQYIDNASDSGSASYTDLFNEKEFDYEYDSAFAERLSTLSKDDLIKDYLELEKQYERGQSELLAKDKEIDDLKKRLQSLEQIKCKENPTSPKVV